MKEEKIGDLQEKFAQLKAKLAEIEALNSAEALLFWDQSTYMPPGGASARASQMAALGRITHEKFTDKAIGSLLDELKWHEQSLPYDSDEASLLRVARRDYERCARVPPSFMQRFHTNVAESYEAWARARPADDFSIVRPYLERTLELSREYAGFFPGYEHIADPLIAAEDYGLTASIIRKLFAELREKLVPLVHAVIHKPEVDDSPLHHTFPEDRQTQFGLDVIRRIGYDMERGRQDKTRHPYMVKFSIGDVRITTRARANNFGEAFFSTLHEAGHAVYEQGICREYEDTPLAKGASAGMHESQSRLWENVVGRSLDFWKFFYPRLQSFFPEQLHAVSLDTFYRAVNKVKPSLIRTEADEVTYNLHVMIRFDLELELLEGKLAVRDLPEAWRARYQNDLGITSPTDRDGVLQDVHWYQSFIGGLFQGYTLGNIISAQLFDAAIQKHPQIISEIESGEFRTLYEWLRSNIYQYGRKYDTSELIMRATGRPMTIDPYIRYLTSKYQALYGI